MLVQMAEFSVSVTRAVPNPLFPGAEMLITAPLSCFAPKGKPGQAWLKMRDILDASGWDVVTVYEPVEVYAL